MSRTIGTSPPTADSDQQRKDGANAPTELVEIELDTQALRALDESAINADGTTQCVEAAGLNLNDTATNLELSQAVDDLGSLCWPVWKPKD